MLWKEVLDFLTKREKRKETTGERSHLIPALFSGIAFHLAFTPPFPPIQVQMIVRFPAIILLSFIFPPHTGVV